MELSELAALIDHTLLSPEATAADISVVCDTANTFRVAAICVSPSRLPIPAGQLVGGIAIATVCGFPTGSHRPEAKAHEARLSAENGANEVDMVLDLGLVKSGDWAAVEHDVATVRAALVESVVLKVILESGALTNDEIVASCKAAESAGANYVKTSTGFHASGGATLAAVELMATTVNGRLGVKASGGIRTRAAAVAMANAGATRIGTSSTSVILAEAEEL